MSDIIDRKVVLELALKIGKSTWKESAIRKWVNELPSVEKTGRWIEHEWAEEVNGILISNYECSICHTWEQQNSNFCPNCGARMISDTE